MSESGGGDDEVESVSVFGANSGGVEGCAGGSVDNALDDFAEDI